MVALISASVTSGYGQNIPLEQERNFLMKAIDLLEAYEYSSTLRSNDDAYTFRNLFENDNAVIYNDLLGISDAENLALNDYIALMRGNAVSPAVKLKNVRKKSLTDDGKNLVLLLTFDKEMRYNNKCGAILSSSAYYDNKDYAMEMEIKMDKATGRAYIESISGSVDSKKTRLGRDFAILEKNDRRDEEIENNGIRLNFNVFDQAFIPIPYNLHYPDEDANMKIVSTGEDCNKLRATYHPLRWIVKPRVNIPLGKGFSYNESSPLLDSKNSNIEFGVDFGYAIPMKSKFRVNVFTGIGFSTGKINLDVASLDYNYAAPASADEDGDTYIRYYCMSNLHQDISLSHLVVPIYADLEYRFHKRISAFLQIGVKGYFNIGSKVNNFTGSMFAYGVYPQYGNLMIDASYLNDFGESHIDETNHSDLTFPGASFDGLAGLGVRANIYGPISIEAGLNYQIGFTNIITATSAPGFLESGNITESQAIATYTVAGGTKIKNLMDYIGNIRRGSLRLNVGLIFKF